MCDCKDHAPARTKAYSCWQVLAGILIKVLWACELSCERIIEVPVLPQVTSSPHMCNCKDHTPARTKAHSFWLVLSGILIKVIWACDLSPEPITEVPVLPQNASSPHMCNCKDHTPARTKAYSCWQVLAGILIKVIWACDQSREPIVEVPVLPKSPPPLTCAIARITPLHAPRHTHSG